MSNLRNPWIDNKRLTVINFFSGPGTGKSTMAAALFAKMRKEGYKVELVPEVTKDLIWDEASHVFGEQDYIFALQHHLLRRLTRHDVDYVIIESSILMTLFYYPWDFPQSFRPFVEDVFKSYDNINIFLDRHVSVPYVQTGRNETEEQAKLIDENILRYFDVREEHQSNDGSQPLKLWRVTVGPPAADTCYRIVKSHTKPFSFPRKLDT